MRALARKSFKLGECRWLYNEPPHQRILAHEDLGLSLTKYQQLMFIPLLKEERPSLESVHSQVLQNVVGIDMSLTCFAILSDSRQIDNLCFLQKKSLAKAQRKLSIEDLNIKKMVEGSCFAKSVLNAFWNQFRQILTCKAVEAGRSIGVVNLAYTTQIRTHCHFR